MTRADHPSGTDRLAEAARDARPGRRRDRGQPAGRRAADRPGAARRRGALPGAAPGVRDGHRRPCRSTRRPSWFNPNVVKVVLDAGGRALYFSRAPIPWRRDALRRHDATRCRPAAPLRHIGLYAYRAGFLQGLSAAGARAAGSDRGAGAAARAVARLSDRGACQPAGAGAGRRHARGPGARPQALRRD